MMDWLRLWHDMPNDPKWRTIARQAKQPIALVQALYLHLLVDASTNETRGNADVTVEDLASALDVDDEQIEAILSAMQGRVLEGRWMTGWEKRQPKRNDDSKERVRRYREKKSAKSNNNGGPDGGRSNGNNGQDNAGNGDVTQSNDDVTPRLDKSREEEIREEQKTSASDDSDLLGAEVVSLICKDKTEYRVEPEYLQEIIKLHPRVNVLTELKAMRAWLLSNPGKRKTRAGMKRFINSWLNRAAETPNRPSGQIHDFRNYQNREQPAPRARKLFPGINHAPLPTGTGGDA